LEAKDVFQACDVVSGLVAGSGFALLNLLELVLSVLQNRRRKLQRKTLARKEIINAKLARLATAQRVS